MPRLTEATISQTVEITKAAIAGQNGPWINGADAVAKFIETVATKIEQLRTGQQQR